MHLDNKKLDTNIIEMFPGDISEVSRISTASEYSITSPTDFMVGIQDPWCDSFVSRVDTNIVGYARCRRDEDDRIAVIDSVSVTPELRRCSIGTQLVDHIKYHLKPFRMIEDLVIVVAETNLNGQLFLKHMGFKCMEIVPCTNWQDCEAGYIMHLPLQ